MASGPKKAIKIWFDRKDEKWYHYDPDSDKKTELKGLTKSSTTAQVVDKLKKLGLRRVI